MNNTDTTSAKKVTFSDAKAGDKVWSLTHGWGVVTARLEPHTPYPLAVEFVDRSYRTYTLWGLLHFTDFNPTLFWDEVKFVTPEKPMPALQVDTKVLVWENNPRNKFYRHFSHFENNKIHAFDGGLSSWTGSSASAWDNWELAE